MRFKDKTVIVTGAGYGLGKQVALDFGREGANVVLAARSKEKIDEVAAELKEIDTRPLAVPTDVSSESDVERLFDLTRAEYGGLDVLINNAGIAGPSALAADVTAADWLETIAINLTGAFYCAKAAAKLMADHAGCSIVNITSVAGRREYPLRSPYSASKWGMIGLSHSLAAEMGTRGIRVNAVAPGAIEGERMVRVISARAEAAGKTYEEASDYFLATVPLGRMVTEQECSDTILFLASDASSGTTGQCLLVDGGMRMQ
ncbi:MAG: SDR family oxidoreductase [bacterium]